MLSRAERERFAGWCEDEARGTEGLVEQMRKLPASALVVPHYEERIFALRLVARLLRSIEDAEVGG
jgi:hypothetical protein